MDTSRRKFFGGIAALPLLGLGAQANDESKTAEKKDSKKICLWRLGSLERGIYPTKEAIDKLIDELKKGPTDLVWGPELDCKVIDIDGADHYIEMIDVPDYKDIELKHFIRKAFDRNILVYDAEASAGQFTKRLISLMKLIMRRNGKAGNLRYLYISPEAMCDTTCWSDHTDGVFHRRYDGSIHTAFGVRLIEHLGFGENNELQKWYKEKGGSLQTCDVELVLGIADNEEVLLGSF